MSHATAADLLRSGTNPYWWAQQEVQRWLHHVSPGQVVTGAVRDRGRYEAVIHLLNEMNEKRPGAMEIEVFDLEGFRVKFSMRNTNVVGRLRITGPDFNPAFAWPEWE